MCPTPILKQRRAKKFLKHFFGREISPDMKNFSAYYKCKSLILFTKMISKDTYAKWCLEFLTSNLSLSFQKIYSFEGEHKMIKCMAVSANLS